MNRATFRKIACLALVLAMLVSAVTMMTVTASAETVAVEKTAPEIVVKGEADVWDKSTKTEPTQVADDGAILITSAAEFAWFYFNTSADDTNTYRLTTSIDLASQNWKNATNFGGVLDGDGYTILNLKVSGGWGAGRAFGTVSGTFKNLIFKGLQLSTENNSANLINTLTGTVSNCRIDATFKSKNGSFLANTVNGGGVVENTIISGTATQGSYTGGSIAVFASTANNCTIRDCQSYVNYTLVGKSNVGVFVYNTNGGYSKLTGPQIINCVNYGNITTTVTSDTSSDIGIFVGRHYRTQDTLISNCVNYGDIFIPGAKVGGIVGEVGDADGNSGSWGLNINNCINYGDITATATEGTETFAGGFIGYNGAKHSTTLTNCANYGDVSGSVAAGLIGKSSMCNNSYASSAIGCANYGNITGTVTTGAVLGSQGTGSFDIAGGVYVANGAVVGVTNDAVTADGVVVIAGEGVATGALEGMTVYTNGTDGTALAAANDYARENAKMPWMAGDTAPELLVCALELDGANLELSGDLVMNLRLDAADLPAGFTYGNVKLATDDNMYEGELIGNYYVFAVKDIPAAEMGTNRDYHIVVEITTGETTVSYKTLAGKSYSPVTYAQNICKRTDEEATKAQNLLQAMVKYAYYAEVMEDGTSAIIDNFNAATGLALTSDIGYTATVRDDVDASNLGAYVSVGANLEAGVNLVFQVNDASVTALELTAGGSTKTYQAEGGYIEITDVHAGMLKNKLDIKLLAGDSEIVSATYAIGNYLDSVATSGAYTEAQQNAAMAAAMYMLAVGQYQTPAYYN